MNKLKEVFNKICSNRFFNNSISYTVKLGRQNIETCQEKLHLKIDFANEDNCGQYYKIDKLFSTNKLLLEKK